MSKNKDKHMSDNNGFGEVVVAETPAEAPAKKTRAPRGSKPLDAISAAKQILALQKRVGAADWVKVEKLVEALASVEA